MRDDLLGLPLARAMEALQSEGISPEVTRTCAPRRTDAPAGVWRVVHASDDGKRLTVAQFLDPIADGQQEIG